MDFIIYSRNFLPLNDAEGYCTARFANALASSGHHVHVVTMDHPQQIPQDVCDELIPMVKTITRVPSKGAVKSYYPRIRYQTPEWDAIDYGESIRCLKRVLSGYDKPILISRMCPAASGIVSWHCRKQASLWINHLSDPFPNYLKGGFLGSIMNAFTMRWARRFLDDSDLCSITCNEVLQFFEEKFGNIDRQKFVLVPHIGDPFLQPERWQNPFDGKPFMAHTGNCYDGRYASEIVKELQIMGANNVHLGFLQAGAMLDKDQELIRKSGIDFKHISLNSPRTASAIFNTATINLVVDLKTNYGYTPFIPSKFVYLLFCDSPIVVFARNDSWMYKLAHQFPEAGIRFADVNLEGHLAEVLTDLVGMLSCYSADRSAIRQLFSGQNVIQGLLDRVTEFER